MINVLFGAVIGTIIGLMVINIITRPEGFMGSFFKRLLGVKVDKVKDAFYKAEAARNPEDMSKAQMQVYMDQLNELTRRMVSAKTRAAKETKDVTDLEAEINVMITAAKDIKIQMDNTEDPELKAGLSHRLEKLIESVEQMKARLVPEKEEAKLANDRLDLLSRAVTTLRDKIQNHKKVITAATDRIETARLKQEMANDAERDAKLAAGILNESDSIGNALEAMNAAAAEMEQAAAASAVRAEVLAPHANLVEEDPIVTAAIKKARGEMDTTGKSLDDRFNDLLK